MFCEKGVLRNSGKFTGKHLCQSLIFNKVRPEAWNFIKKRLAQVFSCEFCKICKNTFFTEHLRATASAVSHWCYHRYHRQFYRWFIIDKWFSYKKPRGTVYSWWFVHLFSYCYLLKAAIYTFICLFIYVYMWWFARFGTICTI